MVLKMKDKLLPLGTIVRVKKTAILMVVGYGMQNTIDKKIYDYSAVAFPMGLDVNEIKLFNKSDIDEIIFIGYQTDKSIEYRKIIDDYVKDIKSGVPVDDAAKKIREMIGEK